MKPLSMLRLGVLALLLACTAAVGSASACEKHLSGHQNSSDTDGEASNR